MRNRKIAGLIVLGTLSTLLSAQEPFWPVIATPSRRIAIDPANGTEVLVPAPAARGRSVSPDGKSRLYFSGGGKELWVAEIRSSPDPADRGGNPRRVAEVDALTGAQWLPDSKRLLFSRGRGPDRAVWIVDVPAAASDPPPIPQRIGPAELPVFDPQVSSDGKIAYLVLRGRRNKEQFIDLIVKDRADEKTICKGAFIFATAFSPDASKIAYALIDELVIHDLASGSSRSVRHAEVHEKLMYTAAKELSWRPDGKAIAATPRFVGGREGGSVHFADDKVVVFPSGEGKPRLLTAAPDVKSLDWMSADEIEKHRLDPVTTTPSQPR